MFLTFYQALSCLEFRLIFFFLSLLMNFHNLGFLCIKSLMCILIPSFLEINKVERNEKFDEENNLLT